MEAQSSPLSRTVFRFFFGQKLTILQPLKQTPLFGPFLGSFSGTAKRGWHHMPPNLTHIISKKLPSFWYMTCPEAICGCRKKSPVFFFESPCICRTHMRNILTYRDFPYKRGPQIRGGPSLLFGFIFLIRGAPFYLVLSFHTRNRFSSLKICIFL